MARPEKHTVDYFPEWKPNRTTLILIKSFYYNIRLEALRNSSSSFIKRKIVREIVFKKDNFKCVRCGAKENLTVDHIISVYRAANDEKLISKLNTLNNLQTLCSKCNAAKKPEEK